MKNIILVICLMLISVVSFGQNNWKSVRIGDADTSKHGLLILKMQNGADVVTTEPSFILQKSEISSQRILPLSEVKAKYQDDKISGIIEFTPKADIKILNLQEIYNHFNVSKEDQSLPVAINGKIIKNKKNVYASLGAIKEVKVYEGKYFNITAKFEKKPKQ